MGPMNKKYLVATIAVLAIIAFAFYTKNEDSKSLEGNNIGNSTQSTTTEEISVGTNERNDKGIASPQPLSPASQSTKDKAWSVFQSYLKAATNKDLEALKKYTYKLSTVCLDPAQKADCEARMGTVAFFGSTFDKKDFVNVWSDEDQIILATNYNDASDGEIYSRIRQIIYFLYDSGELKLLRFSPEQGFYLPKDFGSKEEIDKMLAIRTVDADQDGIEDYIESCIDKKDGCINTDPTKRDTDGNGLWDGIEVQLRKE